MSSYGDNCSVKGWLRVRVIGSRGLRRVPRCFGVLSVSAIRRGTSPPLISIFKVPMGKLLRPRILLYKIRYSMQIKTRQLAGFVVSHKPDSVYATIHLGPKRSNILSAWPSTKLFSALA